MEHFVETSWRPFTSHDAVRSQNHSSVHLQDTDGDTTKGEIMEIPQLVRAFSADEQMSFGHFSFNKTFDEKSRLLVAIHGWAELLPPPSATSARVFEIPIGAAPQDCCSFHDCLSAQPPQDHHHLMCASSWQETRHFGPYMVPRLESHFDESLPARSQQLFQFSGSCVA